MKKLSTLIVIDLFCSLLYSTLNNFKTYSFINCSFTIGMFYLMFGILCYVWEKGFFNITLFSFNKIAQQIQKKRGVLVDDPNISLDEYLTKENYFSYTKVLLISGLLISSITTILSF